MPQAYLQGQPPPQSALSTKTAMKAIEGMTNGAMTNYNNKLVQKELFDD